MAKALEMNFSCLENPLKMLHESALVCLIEYRTVGLMTAALMAARLEAKLDMRPAGGGKAKGLAPFVVGKAQSPLQRRHDLFSSRF